jgi:hypothetical protein
MSQCLRRLVFALVWQIVGRTIATSKLPGGNKGVRRKAAVRPRLRGLSPGSRPRQCLGLMGGRGNPLRNAKAESFMKTPKVEAVCLRFRIS